jgi:hypothetical protein
MSFDDLHVVFCAAPLVVTLLGPIAYFLNDTSSSPEISQVSDLCISEIEQSFENIRSGFHAIDSSITEETRNIEKA